MIIVYGASGFIGKHIIKALNQHGIHYLASKTRNYDFEGLTQEINLYKPTAIVNAAGFPTPNNIDFYEDKISQLTMTNTVGNLMLASICESKNIHYITIMSGCIFNGKRLFTDKSEPNFKGSAYSKNRSDTEKLLLPFKNTCILRIRMPISNDLNPKSLITKLIQFDRITNIKNSVTVLEDCIPFIVKILQKKITGPINLVNQGHISNAYLCFLYRRFLNDKKEFGLCEPDDIHVVPRSNCVLAPSNCVSDTPDAKEAAIRIFAGLKKVKDCYC